MMPLDGSNISAGLLQAEKLLRQAGRQRGELLLITSSTPTTQDYQTVKALASRHMTTSVLAVGTPQGAPMQDDTGFLKTAQGQLRLAKLDTHALKRLAAEGQGRFARLQASDADLKALQSPSLQKQALGVSNTKETLTLWEDKGPVLLIVLVILSAIGFRRGWLTE